MILAADILQLPLAPENPSEYLVIVAKLSEENLTRALSGLAPKKTPCWIPAELHARLRPPFIVLDER